MAQVVEHAHEEHDVEALAERADVVDRELAELDVEAASPRRRSAPAPGSPRRSRCRPRGRRRAASSRSRRSRRCSRCRARVLAGEVRRHRVREARAISRPDSRRGNARARSARRCRSSCGTTGRAPRPALPRSSACAGPMRHGGLIALLPSAGARGQPAGRTASPALCPSPVSDAAPSLEQTAPQRGSRAACRHRHRRGRP